MIQWFNDINWYIEALKNWGYYTFILIHFSNSASDVTHIRMVLTVHSRIPRIIFKLSCKKPEYVWLLSSSALRSFALS